MNGPTVTWGTIVAERGCPFPRASVFDAYADIIARSEWGVASDDDAIEYSLSEFRIGGRDLYRCGTKGDLRHSGSVEYFDIVEGERIVYSEAVSGETLLSVALVTWELFATERGTRVAVTAQVTSFVGKRMIDGANDGTAAALGNLGQWLAENP